MEAVEVPPASADDPASAILLIESPESNNVFENAGTAYGRGNDGEDRVGRQLLFLFRLCICARTNAIPKPKIQGYGHDDGVEDDKDPEDENGHLARPEGIVQRRRLRLKDLWRRARRSSCVCSIATSCFLGFDSSASLRVNCHSFSVGGSSSRICQARSTKRAIKTSVELRAGSDGSLPGGLHIGRSMDRRLNVLLRRASMLIEVGKARCSFLSARRRALCARFGGRASDV